MTAGSTRPHERRLAVAVVVVAQHAEDAQRRPQAQELPAELAEPGRAAGEVAGDDHEVRLRREREVHRLARRAQIEARREAGVEVRELHDGEAVERRGGVRRRQAPVDAAHPLGLVQQVDEAEGGGPRGRGRRPQPVADGSVQLASPGAVPAGPP